MSRPNNSSRRLVCALALVAALALLLPPPVSLGTRSEALTGRSAEAWAVVQDQESSVDVAHEDDSEEEDSERAGGRRGDPCVRRRGRGLKLRRRCRGGSNSGVAKGDFNGDGFGDLAIGVPGEDVGNITNAGAVQVLYGGPSNCCVGGGLVGGLTSTGSQFWTQDSQDILDQVETGDQFGVALY